MNKNSYSKSGCIPQLPFDTQPRSALVDTTEACRLPPAVRAVLNADRAWFNANPNRYFRARWTTVAELRDFERNGVAVPNPDTLPLVTVSLGSRRFHIALDVGGRDPETFNDADAATIVAAATGIMPPGFERGSA